MSTELSIEAPAKDPKVIIAEQVFFLSSKDTARCRRALQELSTLLPDLIQRSEDLLSVWNEARKPLAKLLISSAETCRLLSAEIWEQVLLASSANQKDLEQLLPILYRRLSPTEMLEPSEEVRLQYVKLVRFAIAKHKEQVLAAFTEEIVGILARTVTDNYPEVKRESCLGIGEFAIKSPAGFYSQSERFVKPILGNLTHQHYRVRMASVKAIGEVMLHGKSKSMEDVALPLAQRLFDQSGAVRLAVIEVAGLWCLKLKDRYSWWAKLIPLLVTGLHDNIPSIGALATELWDQVGRQFLQENDCDERIKDQMDFAPPDSLNLPFGRPNLGCRLLVQRNLGILLSGIARELGDWLADIRLRSAQLLCVLVVNGEQNVTQHLSKLLPVLYRSCNDEDSRVASNVDLAAKYLGHFVLPSVYWPLMLPTLEETFLHTGHLRFLAAILSTGKPYLLSSILEGSQGIVEFLRKPSICRSKNTEYQFQLVACCESILTSHAEVALSCAENALFEILFTQLATCTQESLQHRVKALLCTLACIEETDLKSLYRRNLKNVLEPLRESCRVWTIQSYEFSIFEALLTHVPLSEDLDSVVQVLETTMSDEGDPEVRLKLYVLLAEYFQRQEELEEGYLGIQKMAETVAKRIVLPELVWKAGRAAEAIRTAAVSCLCAILENCYTDHGKEELEVDDFDLKTKVLPIVASLADDNAKKTRLYSLRAICAVLRIEQGQPGVSEEQINSTYPSVLKRLDDGCDNVRSMALDALLNLWKARPDSYDLVFNRSHVHFLYTTAIVHLDDPEPSFQRRMLDVLLVLAEVHPELLATIIERCRANFRNGAALERLLSRCHELLRIE